MKNIALMILLIGFCFTAQAQNMLGATFKEVESLYKSNDDFSDWEEKKDSQQHYASFSSKSLAVMYLYFFKDNLCNTYIMVGDEQFKNDVCKIMDATLVKGREGLWFDREKKCAWTLHVNEHRALFRATPLKQ